MTLVLDRAGAMTGPRLREDAVSFELREKDQSASDKQGALSDEALARIKSKAKQISLPSLQRQILLGLVLARYESVEDDLLQEILGMSALKVAAYVHGEEQVPKRYEERLLALDEIARNLHRVLRPQATSRWLQTPIPALKGKTPARKIRDRQLQDVVALTASYVDPSFS